MAARRKGDGTLMPQVELGGKTITYAVRISKRAKRIIVSYSQKKGSGACLSSRHYESGARRPAEAEVELGNIYGRTIPWRARQAAQTTIRRWRSFLDPRQSVYAQAPKRSSDYYSQGPARWRLSSADRARWRTPPQS